MVQVDRGEHLRSGEWLDLNRAWWDAQPEGDPSGRAIPEARDGARVLRLQSGDGVDAVALALTGVDVVGIDFSMPAVRRARARAAQAGVTDRARFVCANLYELRHMLPEPDSFDLVIGSRAALAWLPDLEEWARIVEWFLKPGGELVLEDGSAPPVGGADVGRWEHSTDAIVGVLDATGLRVTAGAGFVATKPA